MDISPTSVTTGQTINITVTGYDNTDVSTLHAYYSGSWHSYDCAGVQTYCAYTFTTAESNAGTYTYTGYVYDTAANGAYTTPSAANVTVAAARDTTLPTGVLNVSPASVTAGQTINITVTGYDNTDVGTLYAYYSGSWHSYDCAGVQTYCAYTFTTSESDAGTYTYTGYVYDAAGNGAYTTPSAANVTVAAARDTTLPTGALNASPASVTTGQTINITVTGYDNTDVSTLHAYYSGSWHSYDCAGVQTYCAYTFTTAESNVGTYTYTGYVYDAAGNGDYTTPSVANVSVAAPKDTTLPTGALSISPTSVTTGQTINITVTGYDNADVGSLYAYYSGSWHSYDCAGVQTSCSHVFATSESNAGTYTYTGYVYDAAGNSAYTTPAALNATVTNPKDTTPPVITLIGASSVTFNSANITWRTDEPADTQVEYGLTTGYGASTPLDTTKVTSHARALGGLSPETLYHYRVRSKDAAGNLAVSADAAFTTSRAPDTQGPSVAVTSPLNGSTLSGTIAVSGTASDNVGVARVEFYVDGALAATDAASPYGFTWDTTKAAGGLHMLTAKAYDAAGNTPGTHSISVTVSNLSADMTIPVLELEYFPLSGTNLDPAVTGLNYTLDFARSHVQNTSIQVIQSLNHGSVYIKDASGVASLRYYVQESREFLSAVPKSAAFAPFPDHFQMLNGVNICDYVDKKGIKQVWIWMYHTADISPIESNMAMGTRSKAYWNYGSYGDVSNSYRHNDLPICNNTYVVYEYNYGRGVGEALEDHGHQLESLFGFIDDDMFWNRFVRPYGRTDGTVNHCGDVHMPPNTATDYDWNNTATVKSNCSDWHPDGSGAVEWVSCGNWNCPADTGAAYKVWWMRRIPGRNNVLTFNGKNLRNWWDFVGDFDAAIAAGKNFFLFQPDTVLPTVSVTAPANGAAVSGTVSVSAAASDNVGVARVEFYADGALAATDSASPYGFGWDTNKISNGSHTLQAKAFDAAGNSAQHQVSVTVNNADTTPPAISQIAPANDIAGKASVTALISDASGILSGSARVYYAVNLLLGCIWPYNWASQAAMTLVSGNTYKALLADTLKNGDKLCIKVEAKDAGPNQNLGSQRYPSNPYIVSGVIEDFQSATILNNGPTTEKADIVFLGDGYTASELPSYRADVQAFMTYLFTQPPFSDYKSFFNVHRVDVISKESGTDNPNCNGVKVDTALDTEFMSTGSDCRLLFTSATGKVVNAAAHAPAADTVIIIVNTPVYGGAATYGGYGVFYRGAQDVMAHELGHSFGWLADEYTYGGPQTHTGGEPSEPNVTINTSRAALKWAQWVQPATPLPTTTSASDTAGLYEGAHYSERGVYRPTYNSKMRSLGVPFERINYSLLVDRIFDYIPQDTTAPQASLTCGRPTGGKMPVALAASDPESYVMAYRVSASASFADTAWQLASNKASFALDLPSMSVNAEARIYAEVRNGYGTDASVSCNQSSVVSAISPDIVSVIPAALQDRSVTVTIPPNSFSDPVTVTIKTPRSLPLAAGFSDSLKATGIGMEITLDKPVQPAEYATIEVFYADSEVDGLNKSDMVIARYDETGRTWVPLESVSYPEINKVTGKTRHFSLFQVMSMRPLSGLAQARIYPNPFYPGRTQGVKFDGLPAGTSVKLYTLQGELVWKGTADSLVANGWQAEWRGVNSSGREVASGLYLVYLETGGSKKTMKLSVVK